ncbi:hypothetical protein LVD17_10515 [Fulvivirga ulvae]|uniref:hypothetical protein n=1 Tax=Fulvivirga ulvae TaxID=2904245 RepID=UPI001F231A61|nr:hypothetical protein [Fulvivirga ulvae]UII34243.1 hypothetical protein LVD17_10515 [Fulvivirga ulvae]
MYRYINILSLDVVAGACICSMFLADFFETDLHWATTLLLGICVWLIYTFDHLNDARNIPHMASTERHRFHQKNFKWLTVICILMLLAAAFLVFTIPGETVMWGVALSCFVLGYFLMLYLLRLKSSYHKEITIAILYSVGILLPALSIAQGFDVRDVSIVFVQFVMLAFTNLLTFAVYEIDSDERDFSPSLVRILGVDHSHGLLKVVVTFQIVLSLILLNVSRFFELEMILLPMITLMGSVVFFRRFYIRVSLYRLVGDAVFCMPLFAILI